MTTKAPCCPHPVERHAYNGCANCGCSVLWDEHPDRDRDTSPEGVAANRARKELDDARRPEAPAFNLLHKLWTKAVGTDGYDKSAWKELERFVIERRRFELALHEIAGLKGYNILNDARKVAAKALGASEHRESLERMAREQLISRILRRVLETIDMSEAWAFARREPETLRAAVLMALEDK